MESRGDVSSIKFSPDRRILAVQRSPKSVVNKTPCHTFYGFINSGWKGSGMYSELIYLVPLFYLHTMLVYLICALKPSKICISGIC